MRYSILLRTYLKNDPRRSNPFNRPTHEFVPSGNAEEDNLYLRGVRSGMISRFYATVSESIKIGHLQAVILDRHNGNQVATFEPRNNSGFARKFGGSDAIIFPLLELIQSIGSEHGVEINLDECHAKVHSAKGMALAASLRYMFAQSQENTVDAQLFAEGVALAKARQSPVKLWHDEQRRGFFSVVNPALAGV